MNPRLLSGVVRGRVDDHHPIDQVRRVFGQGDDDGAAQRVADDLGVADPQPFERLRHDFGLVWDRVARLGLFGAAVAEQVDRDRRDGARSSTGIIPSHQSIAQLKQWTRTIGLPSRGPRSTTWTSPPGRSRILPAGLGHLGGLGLRVEHERVDDDQRNQRRHDPDPDLPASAHGGRYPSRGHGEIRDPRRRPALRRADRRRQQERGAADPRRLPADRGGAAAAPGAADPRHRGPDRAAGAARGRGRLGRRQQRPPLRPRGHRDNRRRGALEPDPRLLPARRAAAGPLRRGADAAARGRLHRPPPPRRPPRRLPRPRRPRRRRPLDRAGGARRALRLRDLHGRALGDGNRERADGGGADPRSDARSPTPPASRTSRTSPAC